MKEFKNIPEEIEILITGFLTGTINNEELDRLNHWITENEEHHRIFNQIKTSWILSAKKVVPEMEKINEAFLQVKHGLKPMGSIPVVSFWNKWRVAASWAVIFILGGLLSLFFSQRLLYKSGLNQFTSISAPLGSKSQVELPDGTKVWLNAGSKISYNSNFGRNSREISLSGEAYFDVTHNEKAPFLVHTTKHVVVKVLGTAFNVKAYPEESYVETTVERGKVQVTKSYPESNEAKTVTLLPKQKVTFECSDNAMSKVKDITETNHHPMNEKKSVATREIILQSNIETKIYTSWKDGLWIIESEPLESIAVKIERNYNMKIEFRDPELKKYIFSGVLKNETLEQVLELMKLSAPIKYRIEKNKVILTKNRLYDN